MIWGPLIAWYLFLAGAAAGAFLTSFLVEVKYPNAVMMRKVGRILAPIMVGVGLLMLMVDAEAGFRNPLRFFGLLANPGSVMTIGVYIICVFFPVSIVEAILELAKKKSPKWLSWIGTVASFGLAMYTGFLLGVSEGVPLWHNAALPVLFTLSALSTGIAAVSLAGAFCNTDLYEKMSTLRNVHTILVGCEATVLAIMLVIVASSGKTGAASVATIVSGGLAPLFWICVVLLGLVIPFCIEIVSICLRKHPRTRGSYKALETLNQGGVLVGGFFLRYVVIMAGVTLMLF